MNETTAEGDLSVNLKELVRVGAHFGHKHRYWCPRMQPYIYTRHSQVDIINLNQSLQALASACNFLRGVTERGGKVLFIGTKKIARKTVREQALHARMPYVDNRWLGGTMTNWKTIRGCIAKLQQLEDEIETAGETMLKKERLMRQRVIAKMSKDLEGIRRIDGLPTALYIIDVKHEAIAVSEAVKMGIPIVGLVDTNSDPANIDHVIPLNDDSRHAVEIVTAEIAKACAEGVARSISSRRGGAETDSYRGVQVVRESSDTASNPA